VEFYLGSDESEQEEEMIEDPEDEEEVQGAVEVSPCAQNNQNN